MKTHEALERVLRFVADAIRGGVVDHETYLDLQAAHDTVHDLAVNHFGDSPDDVLPELTAEQRKQLKQIADKAEQLGMETHIYRELGALSDALHLACRCMTPAEFDLFIERQFADDTKREEPAGTPLSRIVTVYSDNAGEDGPHDIGTFRVPDSVTSEQFQQTIERLRGQLMGEHDGEYEDAMLCRALVDAGYPEADAPERVQL